MLEETAVKYIQKFFSTVSGDFVTLNEIYHNSGLELTQTKKNRKWLSNKQAYFIEHGLVTPRYKGKKLSGLVLTDKGRSYIQASKPVIYTTQGAPESAYMPTSGNGNSRLTLEDVMKAIPRLKAENPGFDIVFDIKLKG